MEHYTALVAENSVGYKIMLMLTPGYPAMSTMTPLVNNPYSVQQPSPDSQSFANMNLASPQHKQGNKAFMASWPLLSQKVENCRSSSTVVFDFHVWIYEFNMHIKFIYEHAQYNTTKYLYFRWPISNRGDNWQCIWKVGKLLTVRRHRNIPQHAGHACTGGGAKERWVGPSYDQ